MVGASQVRHGWACYVAMMLAVSLLWALPAVIASPPAAPVLPTCYSELAAFSLLPSAAEFANATHIRQPALSPADMPAFVALPRCEDEVLMALRCATREGLQVAAKGGGHSFAGYSRVPAPGFVVSMDMLTAVKLDEDSHTVTVTGGAQWHDVYHAFSLSDNTYQVVGGLCPTVGVIGYSQGGGVGPLARAYGMATDNVLSYRVALANGSEAVTADAQTNSDLFWALRGSGGGQFGIVLSLEFQAHLGVPMYTWGQLTFANQTLQMLKRLALYAPDLPRWLNVDAEFDGADQITLWVFGAQPHDVTLAALQVFLSDIPSSDVTLTLKEKNCFWEAIQAYSVAKGYSNSGGPYFLRSFLLPALSSTVAERAAEQAALFDNATFPDLGVGCGQSLIQFGGRIGEIAAEDTAFPWRKSVYMLYASCGFDPSVASSAAAATSALDGWSAAIAPHAQGSYVNFIDSTLPDWEHAYFGSNLQRLQQVKAKWNPHGGALRFKQEITAPTHDNSATAQSRQQRQSSVEVAME